MKKILPFLVIACACCWVSGDDGIVRKEVFGLGTYELMVWPKHLETRKAQDDFKAEHGYPKLLHSLVKVGEFTVVPGAGSTVDMIVPAEAGY